MSDRSNELEKIAGDLERAISESMERPYGEMYLKILCQLAVREPVVFRTMTHALKLKGEWMLAQGAGLEALVQLKYITDGPRISDSKN